MSRRSWKLSSFDLFSLGMVIDGAWIYDEAPDAERAQKALTKLEQIYPVLTGLYDEKKKAIDYEEGASGVLKIESTEMKCCYKSGLTGDRKKAWSLVKPLDVKGFKKGKAHGFSATLVTLSDGAVLYVQISHAFMDGSNFFRFMRQWAALYRGESIEPMISDQSRLPSAVGFSKEETVGKVRELGWPLISFKKVIKMLWNLTRSNAVKDCFTIEVSQDEIGRHKALSGAGTHAVLSAIAARAVLKKSPAVRSIKLLSVCDLRGRFRGMDESFMGNFSQPLMANGTYERDMDTEEMARSMDAGFKSVLHSGSPELTVRLSVCASHYGLPYFSFDASGMNCKNPDILYVNNQLKFRPAELDWGLGPAVYAFPNGLSDMVKFWQPVPGGSVQIIFSGITAKILQEN